MPAVGDVGPVGDPGSTATSWLLGSSVLVLPAVGDVGPGWRPWVHSHFLFAGVPLLSFFPAVGDTGPFGEAGVAARSVCGTLSLPLPCLVTWVLLVLLASLVRQAWQRGPCVDALSLPLHGEMGSVGSIGAIRRGRAWLLLILACLSGKTGVCAKRIKKTWEWSHNPLMARGKMTSHYF